MLVLVPVLLVTTPPPRARARAPACLLPRRTVFTEARSFIYCLAVVGDLVLSGGGDGMVLAHDLRSPAPPAGGGGGGGGCTGHGLLWGLGASSAGAVRALGATRDRIVAAGDDGNALVYSLGGHQGP